MNRIALMMLVIFAAVLLFTITCSGGEKIDSLVEHNSAARRYGAVNVIVRECSGADRVEELNRLTHDRSVRVREKAVKALGESKCYDAVPILNKLKATEKDKIVQDAIAVALKTLGPVPASVKKERDENAQKSAALQAEFAKYKTINMKLKTDLANYMMSNARYYDGADRHRFEQACMQVIKMELTYRIYLTPSHGNHKEIVGMYKEVIPLLSGRIAEIFRLTNAGHIMCYIPERNKIMSLDEIWVEVLTVKK